MTFHKIKIYGSRNARKSDSEIQDKILHKSISLYKPKQLSFYSLQKCLKLKTFPKSL